MKRDLVDIIAGLFKQSKKKINQFVENHFSKKIHHQDIALDIQCPYCKIVLENDRNRKHKFVEREWGYIIHCTNLKRHSQWNTVMCPVPIRSDEHGKPV